MNAIFILYMVATTSIGYYPPVEEYVNEFIPKNMSYPYTAVREYLTFEETYMSWNNCHPRVLVAAMPHESFAAGPGGSSGGVCFITERGHLILMLKSVRYPGIESPEEFMNSYIRFFNNEWNRYMSHWVSPMPIIRRSMAEEHYRIRFEEPRFDELIADCIWDVTDVSRQDLRFMAKEVVWRLMLSEDQRFLDFLEETVRNSEVSEEINTYARDLLKEEYRESVRMRREKFVEEIEAMRERKAKGLRAIPEFGP